MIISKRICLLCLSFFFLAQAYAQTGREVIGVVKDTTGAAVIGARVVLRSLSTPADTLITRTNTDGIFSFKGVSTSSFTLSISSLGYRPVLVRSLNAEGDNLIRLDKPIVMRTDAIALNQVVVKGEMGVVIRQDTIEYTAADFKLKENAVAEDLLKRLDGVEVDRSGNVTSQGKSVTRVQVNGKDFFGGDLKTATKNIPAKAIDKVQIVQDYGDQAKFTGVRDGEPETIINITTKPGSKGAIANATIGGGNVERYQFSAFGNHIQAERNIGFSANLNNNGSQVGGFGFGGRGPSPVTSVNASGGSGNFGAGTGGNESGGSAGITTLGSFGLTYTNRWSKKLVITGGYFFNNTDNNTLSNIFSQNVSSRGELFGTTNSDRNTHNHAHNLNARIEYSMTPMDMLIISPSVGFTTTSGDLLRSAFQTGVIRQDQLSNSSNKFYAPSIGGNILYTHRSKKAGRNYSFNAGARSNVVDIDDDNLNDIRYYNALTGAFEKDSIDHRLNTIDNRTFLTAVRFIYTEPLSKTGSLQFSYNMNYNRYDNSRIASQENPAGMIGKIDSLSNQYDYSFNSQQLGINYSFKGSADEFALGFTANPTRLSGSSSTLSTTSRRSNFYLAPILRYTHRFSRTRNVQLNYMNRASEPTFFQLQPVRDLSDPQRQLVGNPNLNSSFSHTLNANYNSSNVEKRTSFLFRLQASAVDNRVVTNTILIPDAYGSFKREIRYQNADGTYSYSGNYNWQKAFADRQYTFRLSGTAAYNRNVSFADNIRNFAAESSFRQGLGLQINPGEWLEFSPNFYYRYSRINYALPASTDITIHTYTLDADANVFFLANRSLIWRFTAIKNFNSGYAAALNMNPFVFNTSLEKTFMKDRSATMKLTAFDLFNQANNIYRNITDNGFADISTNRLTQYFMLTLTMRLNKLTNGPRQDDDQKSRP
ncbi:MAG TPA: outer membrane beta-barrel protein [Daejeonella sp.]|uniref:outer membrane beta-barrel protein n=1 Tax=Daejeonella sp. TaxID=2805397 RepID=UPI002EDA0818